MGDAYSENAEMQAEDGAANKTPVCAQCGGELSRNPHPHAGEPDSVGIIGAVWECVPCLVQRCHAWSQRAILAERNSIYALMRDCGEWSDKTFGHSWGDGDKAGIGSLYHLREEVDELIDNPSDQEEWADVLTLILDAARRRTISAADLISWSYEKLFKNKKRKWGKPDANGVVHHLKDQPTE